MSARHITDQVAHFTVAALIVTVFASGGAFAGAFLGLALGLIRETAEGVRRMTVASVVTQLSKRDSQIDLAFWTLGGLAAGVAPALLGSVSA